MTGTGDRVAVMQPYLYPYLGYVNLLHAVDTFVVLDDVAWINRGWINRNRILERGEPRMISLPVRKASQNRTIAEHEIADPDTSLAAFTTRVRAAYAASPARPVADALLEPLDRTDPDLTALLVDTLVATATALELSVRFVRSSVLGVPRRSDAQTRIIDLVRAVGGTRYRNLPGGRTLYDEAAFVDAGLELRFVDPLLPTYPQMGTSTFVPGLSVLDAACNVDAAQLIALAATYELGS